MQPIASPEANAPTENDQQKPQFNFPEGPVPLDQIEKNWKEYTGLDPDHNRFLQPLRQMVGETGHVQYVIVERNGRHSHELVTAQGNSGSVVLHTEEITGVQDAAPALPSLDDLFSGDAARLDRFPADTRDLLSNWETYFGETVWKDKFKKKLIELQTQHGPIQLEYRARVPSTDCYYVDVRRAQHLPEVLATFSIQMARDAETGIGSVGEVGLMLRATVYQPKLDEDPADPKLRAIRPIQALPGWFTIDGVIEQWPTIFNEQVLLTGAAARLKDLEESARQEGEQLRVLIKPVEGARMVWIEIYRDLKPGQRITSTRLVDVIRVETAVVDYLEQAIQVMLSGDFVSSRHRPLKDPAQVVAESTKHAAQFTVTPPVKPTDLRTLDAEQFKQFLETVRRANISDTNRARLSAFETFVQSCTDIENDLYYHCTALGEQLDTMLMGGQRHFPNAAPGTPPSFFAPGGRWGSFGTGMKQHAFTLPVPSSNPHHASDVVISVYGCSGQLIGVYQCNFQRASA